MSYIEENNTFGGWSMNEECFEYIKENLSYGKTILEFGSGFATGELAKHYNMYSVENDDNFLNKYPSTYIHAPIKKYEIPGSSFSGEKYFVPAKGFENERGWYDPDILKDNLPKEYDLILVDGPIGHYGRSGFLLHLEWFKSDVPIIIDDVHREPEKNLLEMIF